MQHDHVLKKLNFDLFDPTPKSTQAFDQKSRLIGIIFIVPLSVCEILVKHIDN